jgi:hypothetical protein
MNGSSLKRSRPFLALTLLTLAAGCAGQARAAPLPSVAVPVVERIEPYRIGDHRTQAEGGELPEWLRRYLSGGAQGPEAMSEYRDAYVFVAEDTSANLKALGQWASGFRVNQDFPRLAAARIQDRMTRAAGGNPDAEYGRYFERVIRASSDAVYPGAIRGDDFWVLKRYLREDDTLDREIYAWYILVSIDRGLLQQQISAILDETAAEPPPSREQAVAIARMKENFFVEF